MCSTQRHLLASPGTPAGPSHYFDLKCPYFVRNVWLQSSITDGCQLIESCNNCDGPSCGCWWFLVSWTLACPQQSALLLTQRMHSSHAATVNALSLHDEKRRIQLHWSGDKSLLSAQPIPPERRYVRVVRRLRDRWHHKAVMRSLTSFR